MGHFTWMNYPEWSSRNWDIISHKRVGWDFLELVIRGKDLVIIIDHVCGAIQSSWRLISVTKMCNSLFFSVFFSLLYVTDLNTAESLRHYNLPLCRVVVDSKSEGGCKQVNVTYRGRTNLYIHRPLQIKSGRGLIVSCLEMPGSFLHSLLTGAWCCVAGTSAICWWKCGLFLLVASRFHG